MKPLGFLGSSRDDIRAMPAAVRQALGEELVRVQFGGEPRDFKSMPSVGLGARGTRAGTARVRKIRPALEGTPGLQVAGPYGLPLLNFLARLEVRLDHLGQVLRKQRALNRVQLRLADPGLLLEPDALVSDDADPRLPRLDVRDDLRDAMVGVEAEAVHGDFPQIVCA